MILLSWFTTLFFIPLFFGTLLIFHPLHLIALTLGKGIQRTLLNLMNVTILELLHWISGTEFKVTILKPPPKGVPLILVANHQSMYDIPLLIWHLREYQPQFISKRELGRWIPSISLLLRTMGALLINRGDRGSALSAIESYGRTMNATCGTVVIFPEGTRARDGKIKPFKSGGFAALLQSMPDAVVIPVSISGSYRLLENSLLPVPFGSKVKLKVMPPVSVANRSPKVTLAETESIIAESMADA